MKPLELVFHFLLLSSGTTYTAEVISGWRLSEECFDDPHSCELIHYNVADDHDVINILKLLDKVRKGFFQAVLVLPPASTWSRARHFGRGGQPPVRSRAQPWGITDTTDNRHAQVVHDNRSVEILTWFTEQSLKCAASDTALISIFSDDFGGHAKSGPASLWSLQELRSLHGQDDAPRGATFLCRIAGTDTERPLGIFTNLPGLQQSLQTGWPALTIHGTSLHCTGPQPKSCGCSPPHPSRSGATSNENFYTHLADPFGEQFWKWCFFCTSQPVCLQLRYGWGRCDIISVLIILSFLAF